MVGRVGWSRGCPTSPRIAPEVARALAAGEAVVALESTLIAHGLPRGRNLEVARELEAVVRAEGAVPATIAVVAGEVRIGLDDAALEALALGPGFAKAGLRDLAPVIAARRLGGDDRRLDLPPRRPGRHPRVRHRRARRRPPRGARELGRVGRPDHARADRRDDRLLGREVDPRRRRDARAARDAQRLRARLRHRPLPRLLPRRLRLRRRLAGRHARRGRGRDARAGGRRARTTARSWWRTRCPPPSRSTRRCTTACWPSRSPRPRPRGSAAARRRRSCSTASTAGPAARRSTANVALVRRNAALAARIARAAARMSRIVVAGDVMRDVVATLAAPIAHGSDTPAAIAERGGGAGANVAAWLARAGAAGDADRARRRRPGRPRRGRRAARGGRRPAARRSTRSCRPGRASCSSSRAASGRCCPTPARTPRWSPSRCPPDASHLHVAGYALLRPGSRAAARALIAAARDAGATVSVDPSSAAPLARRAAVPRLGRGRRPAAAEPRRGGGADRRSPSRTAPRGRCARRSARSSSRSAPTARCGATATRSCTCPPSRCRARTAPAPATRSRPGLLAARAAGAGPADALRAGCALAVPRGRAGRR